MWNSRNKKRNVTKEEKENVLRKDCNQNNLIWHSEDRIKSKISFIDSVYLNASSNKERKIMNENKEEWKKRLREIEKELKMGKKPGALITQDEVTNMELYDDNGVEYTEKETEIKEIMISKEERNDIERLNRKLKNLKVEKGTNEMSDGMDMDNGVEAIIEAK